MAKTLKSYRIDEETVAAVEAEASKRGESAAAVVNALLSEALSHREGEHAAEPEGHETGRAEAPDAGLVRALETNASDLRATVAVLREQLAAKDEQIAAAHAIAAREQERASRLLEAARDAREDREEAPEGPAGQEEHREEPEPSGRLRRALLALRGRL